MVFRGGGGVVLFFFLVLFDNIVDICRSDLFEFLEGKIFFLVNGVEFKNERKSIKNFVIILNYGNKL